MKHLKHLTTIAALAALLAIAFGPARAADLTVGVCGQTVAITCGTGPGPIPPVTVTVPNVVGMTQAAATGALTGAGLALGGVTQQSSTSVPQGNVISQSPGAGSSVAPGSSVALIASSGSAQVGCAGFDNTRTLVENWANPQRMLTSSVGGFGQSDIVVVQFTTGNAPSTQNLLKIAGAEYQGPPTPRVAALSDKPCDFVGLRDPVTFMPYWCATATGTSVTIPFTIDNPDNFGCYPILHANTTYYFNVKIAGACTSGTGVCDMAFDLIKYNNTLAKARAPLELVQPPKAKWPSMQRK